MSQSNNREPRRLSKSMTSNRTRIRQVVRCERASPRGEWDELGADA